MTCDWCGSDRNGTVVNCMSCGLPWTQRTRAARLADAASVESERALLWLDLWPHRMSVAARQTLRAAVTATTERVTAVRALLAARADDLYAHMDRDAGTEALSRTLATQVGQLAQRLHLVRFLTGSHPGAVPECPPAEVEG